MLPAVERLIVVLGAHRDAVAAAVPADQRITIIENRDYRLGQLSSIKSGLRAVSANADAAMLHLVDHPTVMPRTFARLVEEYETFRKPIMITRCAGRRGHPVLFDRSVFGELERAPLEVGARAVLTPDTARVMYVDVDDPGILLDLDTPADLAQARLAGKLAPQ
jgi:molybdenum cofactor cytidylyltransferase